MKGAAGGLRCAGGAFGHVPGGGDGGGAFDFVISAGGGDGGGTFGSVGASARGACGCTIAASYFALNRAATAELRICRCCVIVLCSAMAVAGAVRSQQAESEYP